MAQDEDLQALARARSTAPDDPGLVLRHALALSRGGQEDAAERLLVAALDLAPGQPDLTAALDRLAAGRARGAPWPSERCDPSRTGRSPALGPTAGRRIRVHELDLDSHVERVVACSPGRTLVLTLGGLYEVGARGEPVLVTTIPREIRVEHVTLLPAGRILLHGPSVALALVPRDGAVAKVRHKFPYSSSFAVGSSGLLYAHGRRGRVDAFPVAFPAEGKTVCRTDVDAQALLALAPGGDLVVVVGGAPRSNRPARLERVSPSGEVRFVVELETRELHRGVGGPVVGRDGTVYVGFPGHELYAIDAAGRVVSKGERCTGEPAGLAGPEGEFLVLRAERSLKLVDVRSGEEVASLGSAFFGIPKIDARGWVYARRGDDLVAWDPTAPGRLALEVRDVAARAWDFVLDGEGRARAFARQGATCAVTVIE